MWMLEYKWRLAIAGGSMSYDRPTAKQSVMGVCTMGFEGAADPAVLASAGA